MKDDAPQARSSDPARPFQIGDWRVEPDTGRLTKDGQTIRLEPKVMDLLVYLTQRPGRVLTREELEQQRLLHGSDFVGTPDEIIAKILFQHDIFKHQRFLIYMGNNSIEHKKMMRAIELFGTKVAPVVRKEIARRNSSR